MLPREFNLIQPFKSDITKILTISESTEYFQITFTIKDPVQCEAVQGEGRENPTSHNLHLKLTLILNFRSNLRLSSVSELQMLRIWSLTAGRLSVRSAVTVTNKYDEQK